MISGHRRCLGLLKGLLWLVVGLSQALRGGSVRGKKGRRKEREEKGSVKKRRVGVGWSAQ